MTLQNLKLLTNYLSTLSERIVLAALIFSMVFPIGCQINYGREKTMSNSIESEAIQKFRERLNQGNLAGINVTYRISGGMPAEGPIEEECSVSGNNLATLRSVTGTNLPQEASAEFAPAEVQSLLTQVGQGIDSLVPRSEAQFLPDSVVGSITLDIDGEQATFYFLVEEEERQSQNKPIAPAMAEAIDTFSNLSEQLLQRGGN
jgi:hypothetical protein